jgi:excisionase family DNA binding protein
MNDIVLTSIDKEEIKQIVTDAVQLAIGRIDKDQDQAKFLNADQACEFLGIAKPTLYTKCSKQLIPYFKQGKKLYFHQAELVAWLKSGKRKTIADIRAEVEMNLGRKGEDLFKKK